MTHPSLFHDESIAPPSIQLQLYLFFFYWSFLASAELETTLKYHAPQKHVNSRKTEMEAIADDSAPPVFLKSRPTISIRPPSADGDHASSSCNYLGDELWPPAVAVYRASEIPPDPLEVLKDGDMRRECACWSLYWWVWLGGWIRDGTKIGWCRIQ